MTRGEALSRRRTPAMSTCLISVEPDRTGISRPAPPCWGLPPMPLRWRRRPPALPLRTRRRLRRARPGSGIRSPRPGPQGRARPAPGRRADKLRRSLPTDGPRSRYGGSAVRPAPCLAHGSVRCRDPGARSRASKGRSLKRSNPTAIVAPPMTSGQVRRCRDAAFPRRCGPVSREIDIAERRRTAAVPTRRRKLAGLEAHVIVVRRSGVAAGRRGEIEPVAGGVGERRILHGPGARAGSARAKPPPAFPCG